MSLARSAPTVDSLGAPPEVARWLAKLAAELPPLCGAGFALVLYGGLARGRFRPGKSDVNVLLALDDPSAARLAKIAPLLREAYRAIRLEPFIVSPAELPRLAEAFPTKLLDIQEQHVLLAGADPFGSLHVPPALVRARIAQSLQNLLLRLRRRLVSAYDTPADLTNTLAETARPLALELAAALKLAGKAVPEDRTSTIFTIAAETWGLPAQDLAALAELRVSGQPQKSSSASDPIALYGRVLAILEQAARLVAAGEAVA